MSCGVGRRHGLDLVSLWLWRSPVAKVPIRPLAWKPPYTVGAALKKQKTKQKKKEFFICSGYTSFVKFVWLLRPL